MLHLINILCKTAFNTNSKNEFEDILQAEKFNFNSNVYDDLINSLIHYKHPRTGDTILNYASRCGNVNLIKMIYENYVKTENFLDFSNNDGKNALHEVNRRH